MSACAIGAAGYLCHRGQINASEHERDARAAEKIRNEATARHVEVQARSHGKVCPHCHERIGLDAFETHVLLAHQQVIEPAGVI